MTKVDAAKFVMRCQNWFELAIPIVMHRPPPRVILEKGVCFVSRSIWWADVADIFFNKVYTPYYFPLEKNDLVVDIGANIGVFTVYAALRTQNTVYAFEPFPSNFEALQQNIRANGLRNVKPYQYAVCDSNGTELLLETEENQAHRLKKVAHGEDEKYIEVPSTTLQDFMDKNHIEQIDFLKMDCEGSEGLIMKSLPKDYLQRIRKIVIEVHNETSKLKHDQIQKLLEDAGFTTYMKWAIESALAFVYAWQE